MSLNLITDRTQADVEAQNSKGSYDYVDANRVTSAVSYLVSILTKLGYDPREYIPFSKKTVKATNIVKNGSFETDETWNNTGEGIFDNSLSYVGDRSFRMIGTSMLQQKGITPIAGRKYYGRTVLKSDGIVSMLDGRFELWGGDGLGKLLTFARNMGDFKNWTVKSSIQSMEQVLVSNFTLRNFTVNANKPVWCDGLIIIDLTETFGAGNEPDLAWCDAHIPYFDGTRDIDLDYWWDENDIPTVSQMEQYLKNVRVLRDKLRRLDALPDSMDNLTHIGANDIEKALLAVEDELERMQRNIDLGWAMGIAHTGLYGGI